MLAEYVVYLAVISKLVSRFCGNGSMSLFAFVLYLITLILFARLIRKYGRGVDPGAMLIYAFLGIGILGDIFKWEFRYIACWVIVGGIGLMVQFGVSLAKWFCLIFTVLIVYSLFTHGFSLSKLATIAIWGYVTLLQFRKRR